MSALRDPKEFDARVAGVTGLDCPACGKPNRSGQQRCVICGTPLDPEQVGVTQVPAEPKAPPLFYDEVPLVDVSADAEARSPPVPDTAPVIERVERERPTRATRRIGPPWYEEPWVWPAAIGALLVVTFVVYWVGVWLTPGAGSDAILLAPPLAQRPQPVPPRQSAPAPVVTVPALRPSAPPPPPAVLVVPFASRAEPDPRPPADPPVADPPVAAPPVTPPRLAPTVPAAPPIAAPKPTAPPVERAARSVASPAPARAAPAPDGRVRERPAPAAPSLPASGARERGDSNAQYRGAVAAHNARVDEYNAIVAELYREGAWDDAGSSPELHPRLEQARSAVERARARAEQMRSLLDAERSGRRGGT